MGTVCAIHQPNFFPRLSTIAKLFTADVHVVLTDVQFTRRDYQHRCRLHQPHTPHDAQWLTLPVHLPHGRNSHINQVSIVDAKRTRKRVHQLIQQHYRRALYWRTVRDITATVTDLIDDDRPLMDISTASTSALLEALGWSGITMPSEQLRSRTGRSTRLADLTTAAGATHYLCGSGGARYLTEAPFHEQGITITYYQLPTQPAIPWHHAKTGSILCWLAHLGPHQLRTLLTNAAALHRHQPPHDSAA